MSLFPNTPSKYKDPKFVYYYTTPENMARDKEFSKTLNMAVELTPIALKNLEEVKKENGIMEIDADQENLEEGEIRNTK
jgi:hypothetical protein